MKKTMQTELKTNKPLELLRWLWAEYSVLYALVLIVVIASFLNPHFLTFRNITNILKQVSVIGIISMGMTVVILSGGIDLSVGSVLALVGVASVAALNYTGNVAAAVAAALLLGALIGAINGLIITKGQIAPFIATLGMMAVARSLALYFISGGSIVGQISGYTVFANAMVLKLRLPIYFFFGITLLAAVLMRKTRFGRYIYAIGSNERAALLSAIHVDRVKLWAYVLCSTLTAAAAVIEASNLNSISSASSGHSYELDAIAAVIIGGTRLSGGRGRIVGTLLGVLLLGVLNNVLNLLNLSPFLQGFVKGIIIIIAVLLQKKK